MHKQILFVLFFCIKTTIHVTENYFNFYHIVQHANRFIPVIPEYEYIAQVSIILSTYILLILVWFFHLHLNEWMFANKFFQLNCYFYSKNVKCDYATMIDTKWGKKLFEKLLITFDWYFKRPVTRWNKTFYFVWLQSFHTRNKLLMLLNGTCGNWDGFFKNAFSWYSYECQSFYMIF